MTDTDLLWQAFLAGFDESGEGFNGEYLDEKYRGWSEAFVREMRPAFEEWLREHGGS